MEEMPPAVTGNELETIGARVRDLTDALDDVARRLVLASVVGSRDSVDRIRELAALTEVAARLSARITWGLEFYPLTRQGRLGGRIL